MPGFAELPLPSFPHAVVVAAADEVRMCHGEWKQSFPWASVTKLLTAYATLIAVERRLVDLDHAAGPPGATVRHLLAHTSGLDFNSDQIIARPASTRIYSNRGIEVLGEHMADATGVPIGEWIEQTVLGPLGMATVIVDGSPAYSATGTTEDLATFGQELLAPTLVSRQMHATATSAVFPGLHGVVPGYGRQEKNEWGLGFEVRDSKSPHWTGAHNSPATYGHFGRAGSFLWVDPVAGLTTAFLGAEPYDDWAYELWPQLSDAVLAEYA